MDARIKAELQDLHVEGEKLLLKQADEVEDLYGPWAAKLEAALTLVGSSAAATIEFNKTDGAHQRIAEDLVTLRKVLADS